LSDNTRFVQDGSSDKYYRFSTRWITELFIRNIIDQVRKINPESILDAGCGTGYVANEIKKSFNANMISFDLDKKRVSIAHNCFGLETIIADINCLPFKDASFDIALAIEIIEHLPNNENAYIELKRVVKSAVIITVPNDPYFMIANFFRGKNLKTLGNPHDHIRHYNKNSLKIELSPHFSIINIKNNAFLWLTAVATAKTGEKL
jgi:ubiquinone/menaquinone biosynthesis C-methylase UbiE